MFAKIDLRSGYYLLRVREEVNLVEKKEEEKGSECAAEACGVQAKVGVLLVVSSLRKW